MPSVRTGIYGVVPIVVPSYSQIEDFVASVGNADGTPGSAGGAGFVGREVATHPFLPVQRIRYECTVIGIGMEYVSLGGIIIFQRHTALIFLALFVYADAPFDRGYIGRGGSSVIVSGRHYGASDSIGRKAVFREFIPEIVVRTFRWSGLAHQIGNFPRVI